MLLYYYYIITLVNTKFVVTKFERLLGVFWGAESEYGISFVELAMVFEILTPLFDKKLDFVHFCITVPPKLWLICKN